MAEGQVSSTVDNREKVMNVPVNGLAFLTIGSLIPLQEGQQLYEHIENVFLDKMGRLASETSIVAIQQNAYSSWSGHFRRQSHHILSEAVYTKCGGNFNCDWGWYGASKDDMSGILSDGFTRPDEPVSGRSHGVGIHLTSPDYLLEEVLFSTPDEEGIRYISTCFVVLGTTEVISDHSEQYMPSSAEFDTGVDNSLAPKKYIVWSAYMNSYLQPQVVISFKCPKLNNYSRKNLISLIPTMPLENILARLVRTLERIMDPPRLRLIYEYYDLLRQGKILISQTTDVIRRIVGDDLWYTLVKYAKNKQLSSREMM